MSGSDSNTDKKRVRGLLPWLFLFVLTLPFVSFFLGGYLRELHGEQSSDVHRCVQFCKPLSIKTYDGPRGICKCQAPKEK